VLSNYFQQLHFGAMALLGAEIHLGKKGHLRLGRTLFGELRGFLFRLPIASVLF